MSNIDPGHDPMKEVERISMLEPAKASIGEPPPKQSMAALVVDLVRPYRKWLIIVFIAMLVETAMTLLAPWPLKVIIDNVVGSHKMPEWLGWAKDLPMGNSKEGLAAWAGISIILIALIGGVAGYIDNYYT